MPDSDKPGSDEWRLGIDIAEHAEPHPEAAPAPARPSPELSAARLGRPIYVMTAEHFGWILIAIYAIATRLVALGARPMFPREAFRALAELGMVRPYPYVGWVGLAQTAAFGALGTSDGSARIVAALSGLLLIYTAFAMRPYIGRAGALGFAAALTLSPTLTYFSRAGLPAITGIAFTMAVVALVMAVERRPTLTRAAGIGCALALALTSSACGVASIAAGTAALAMVGIGDAIIGKNTWLRIRVWWTRRAGLTITASVVALLVFIALATLMFRVPLGHSLAAQAHTLFPTDTGMSIGAGARFYLPILGFYEFALVIGALAGLILVAAFRVRSYFATWAVLWILTSLGVYVAIPSHREQFAVGIVVPMGMVAAIAIDWLHHLDAWRYLRYAIAALAALTIYQQALTGAIYAAPDATEAPWARHATLFWSEPASTIQMRRELRRAFRIVASKGATAWVPGDLPVAAWYLRGFENAEHPDTANIDVSRAPEETAAAPGALEHRRFGAEETWVADPSALTAGSALRFFLTARAWNDVEVSEVAISIRPPSTPVAPTVIVAPPPEPVSSPSPTAAATSAATSSPRASVRPTVKSSPAAKSSPVAAVKGITKSSPAVTTPPSASPTPSPLSTALPTSIPTATGTVQPTAVPTTVSE